MYRVKRRPLEITTGQWCQAGEIIPPHLLSLIPPRNIKAMLNLGWLEEVAESPTPLLNPQSQESPEQSAPRSEIPQEVTPLVKEGDVVNGEHNRTEGSEGARQPVGDEKHNLGSDDGGRDGVLPRGSVQRLRPAGDTIKRKRTGKSNAAGKPHGKQLDNANGVNVG